MQKFDTQALINSTEVEYKLLKGVETAQALGKFGTFKEQPKNSTDTLTFVRLNPFNMDTTYGVATIDPQDFMFEEGVTPDVNTISYTTIPVTLNEYDVLFKYTNKTALMSPFMVTDDMISQTTDVIAEIAELVAFGQFKAGTSVVYANGSTRAGLNKAISMPILRLAVRGLKANGARNSTTMIKSGENFGTSPGPAGYICFCSSDMGADIRDLPHFTPKEAYGFSRTAVHPDELGICEEFTFIGSRLLKPWLAAGAADDGTMVSAASANNDVYPMIVMAADAWGHVSLNGRGHTGIKPIHVPWDRASHYNPSRKFGFVGATFNYNAVRLNEFFMTRVESCASELTQ
jgi:N4-gp56 family major capsid protein